MTLSDIQNLVALKLGEQSLFYSPEEVIRSGINPAQRLLCLVYPLILNQRATATVGADLPFIDLRQVTDASGIIIGNRIRKVNRVMLGNVRGDAPVHNAVTDELFELRETTVAALSKRANDWMSQRGLIRHYWKWGTYWLGLYKRPITATTVTIIYDAVPAQLMDDADDPQTQDVYHRTIAEIATGLLLIKEGEPQGSRGLQRIIDALALKQQGQAA